MRAHLGQRVAVVDGVAQTVAAAFQLGQQSTGHGGFGGAQAVDLPGQKPVTIDQGKQLPRLKNAVPTTIGPVSSWSPIPSFRSSVVFWMAPVGQTCPQSRQ